MAPSWTEGAIPDLTGTTALVTGANAGLGYDITRLLATHGARVLMACRNEQKATSAADALRRRGLTGTVETRPLDLARLASIDALSSSILASEPSLAILVNNAGLMAIDQSRTEDGFEMQFGVNHLGHFALTAGLLPLLASTPSSRVVTMSSMGHRAGRMHFDDLMFDRRYRRWGAYFQSKLANLLFSAELQRRLGGTSTIAVAAHPGGSNTDLGFEGSGLLNAGARLVVPHTAQSAEIGARPAVRAATDPSVRGGEFYGPRFMAVGAVPIRERPSRRARNADDARRLWARSEELTQRTFLPFGA